MDKEFLTQSIVVILISFIVGFLVTQWILSSDYYRMGGPRDVYLYVPSVGDDGLVNDVTVYKNATSIRINRNTLEFSHNGKQVVTKDIPFKVE